MEAGRFHVRQFDPEKDDIKQLVEIDRKICKDERNVLDATRAKEWLSINSTIFAILYDNHGQFHGFSKCLPIRDSYIDMVKIEKPDFPSSLKKEYVLTEEQAKIVAQRGGNLLYACLHICHPESGRQDPHFSILLFSNLRTQFYRYRMCQIITRPLDEMGKALVEEGGCIKLYDLRRTKDGISSVYYFDMEQALKKPTTGLGVIFANIWGFAGYRDRFPLELTEKEREVLMLRLGGCSYKEVAEILGISAYALEGRMKRIDQKAKKLGLQDRKSILAYAAHQ